MSLTKLEVLNLDLPIGSYKNHKSAFKTVFLSYPSNTQSLTTGVHRSAGPTCHRHRNRGDGIDGAAHGEARRRRLLRRKQVYQRAPLSNPHRLVPRTWPIPNPSLAGGESSGGAQGTAALRRRRPAMVPLELGTSSARPRRSFLDELRFRDAV